MSEASAITTIKELIEFLENCPSTELKDVYRFIDIPKSEFERYAFFSDTCYTRNCIVKTEHYELILMCWKEGQSAAIHCHDGQECWVYNVEGCFKEYRYRLNDNNEMVLLNEYDMNEDIFTYMTDNMGYHDLHNANIGNSISLHLYAKPLKKCKVYNNETKSFDMKKLVYHSYDGETTEHYS